MLKGHFVCDFDRNYISHYEMECNAIFSGSVLVYFSF